MGLLDALGLPSATVVGHDFGAATAWSSVMMRPDRFTAVFGISVPYLPLGGPSLFEAMEAAGKVDSFYMFKQREPEADERWTDARITYPGLLYWSSASPAPEDRWDPFDTTREMYRQAPVSVPPWADAADVEYAIMEFERTGFNRPLNYYRSLQAFFDLGKSVQRTGYSYSSILPNGRCRRCEQNPPGGRSRIAEDGTGAARVSRVAERRSLGTSRGSRRYQRFAR